MHGAAAAGPRFYMGYGNNSLIVERTKPLENRPFSPYLGVLSRTITVAEDVTFIP